MQLRCWNALFPTSATLFLGCSCVVATLAQTPGLAVSIPASSVANAGDAGVRAHTNIEILGARRLSGGTQNGRPPFPGYLYETPASIACIYELQLLMGGCNPEIALLDPGGGSRAIAVVDAYHDPNAYFDLQTFSAQFGIIPVSPSSFTVVYAPPGHLRLTPVRSRLEAPPGSCVGAATQPPSDVASGWDIEASLDIEYAHAMAPAATLYLVEAQSDSYADLLCAVTVASDLVTKADGGEVSMSWGSAEFPEETAMDQIFTAPTVVYLSATGDAPGVLYPSSSPNVVAVGGTSLSTNYNAGDFELETTWQETGGGRSAYEPRPSYQNGIASLVGTQRGTPDVAAVANPYTGVWVLDNSEWYIVGGTSVATVVMAGIVNAANSFLGSSFAELTQLYQNSFEFSDVTLGNCGPGMGSFAMVGWDFCSGLGSPRGYLGK